MKFSSNNNLTKLEWQKFGHYPDLISFNGNCFSKHIPENSQTLFAVYNVQSQMLTFTMYIVRPSINSISDGKFINLRWKMSEHIAQWKSHALDYYRENLWFCWLFASTINITRLHLFFVIIWRKFSVFLSWARAYLFQFYHTHTHKQLFDVDDDLGVCFFFRAAKCRISEIWNLDISMTNLHIRFLDYNNK